MKATYFFSQKQKQIRLEMNLPSVYIRDKQYTEMMTQEGEHKSAWDDAEIVCVIDNLPIDEFHYEMFGTKHAKI